MRLLMSGGRHFEDSVLVEGALSAIHRRAPITVLIHGGTPGLGAPAESWARRNAVHLVRYPANFSLGKRGDFERDRFMLEDGRPQALLAFPGGRRTAELCQSARRRGTSIIYADAAPAPIMTRPILWWKLSPLLGSTAALA
jgi:hypothetical protein